MSEYILGNKTFIPDWLIMEWGADLWGLIKSQMIETCELERSHEHGGYVLYDRSI